MPSSVHASLSGWGLHCLLVGLVSIPLGVSIEVSGISLHVAGFAVVCACVACACVVCAAPQLYDMLAMPRRTNGRTRARVRCAFDSHKHRLDLKCEILPASGSHPRHALGIQAHTSAPFGLGSYLKFSSSVSGLFCMCAHVTLGALDPHPILLVCTNGFVCVCMLSPGMFFLELCYVLHVL